MASSSRKRETASSGTGADAHFLSDVIRTADIDCMNIEKRTKFIKAQLDSMSEDQLTRFEFFVRSHLSRGKVKEILTAAIPAKYTITDDMAIVVGSLAKLFVGELVETSMDVLGERNALRTMDRALSPSEGPTSSPPEDSSLGPGLQTDHLREGYRRMQCEGKIGLSSGASCPFSRKRILQSVDDIDSILMGSSPPDSAALGAAIGAGGGAGAGRYGTHGSKDEGTRPGTEGKSEGDAENEEEGGEGEDAEEGNESSTVKAREDSKHGNRESDNIS